MKKMRFRNISLKNKIILIAVISTFVSLFAACVIYVQNVKTTLTQDKMMDLSSLSNYLSDEIREHAQWTQGKPPRDMFDSLRDNPDILTAAFYGLKGETLIEYRSNRFKEGASPSLTAEGRPVYSKGRLKYFSNVQIDGKKLGSLYLMAEADEIESLMASYLRITLFVWAVSLFLSYITASYLQKRVSRPLRQIVDRMKDIARGEGDLTNRLEVSGSDEMGEMAEAFNAFVGKLQTVEEMKLDLISVVSHQLKTPVAEINGFVENMMDGLAGELTPKQRRYLEEMRRIGLDNYRLICGLLNASKIDRGVVSVNLKPVLAKEVVNLAVRDYSEALKRKGLEFQLEGLEENLWLDADSDKLIEALRNLLNNAMKCTDRGTVTLRAGSEGDMGFIEVQDTGIGMDEKTLGRLFTKSRVLGKEAHRSGAGLGLYISKNFMKLQKGDITVLSQVGRGSCFKLIIPKVRSTEGAVS